MTRLERQPAEGEVDTRTILGLARTFVVRWDVHARQLDDGRYVCVHEPLNVGHLRAHLMGEATLGTYLLDPDSRARFVVLDVDDDERWQQVVALAPRLAEEGIPTYLEGSRRGGHTWFFLGQALPGESGRAFGRGIVAAHHLEGVEVFPKQGRLGAGPGSLIRLPFGLHRITRRRYSFVTAEGKPLAPTVRRQIGLLSTPSVVSKTGLEAYQSLVPTRLGREGTWASETVPAMLSGRIKASVSVLEFVSQYVDLKPTGSGAVGLCPFHDDHHPSFAVNSEGNFWFCFAGCGGGSLIDWWMKWRGCDFGTAVRELAEMLL